MALPADSAGRSLAVLHPGAIPTAEDYFFQAVYFSWAPLDGVASTLVFRDQATGHCKGILFRYLNGGSRVVGECRFHVDPAQTVARPSTLCVQTESYPISWNLSLLLHKARATFQHSPEHEHEHSVGEEWECYPMAGYAKFWFTAESSFLRVTTEQDTETAAQS